MVMWGNLRKTTVDTDVKELYNLTGSLGLPATVPCQGEGMGQMSCQCYNEQSGAYSPYPNYKVTL